MKIAKLTRRSLLKAGVAGTALALTASLAGCGEEEAAAPVQEAAPAATKKVEAAVTAKAMPDKPKAVNLALWYNLTEYTIPAWDKMVDIYQERNPHVTVEANGVPHGDAAPKILTALAGGLAPDLVYNHAQFVHAMAAKNAITSLEPFIKADKDFNRDDFYPFMLKLFSHKGELYTLPNGVNLMLQIYNRDLIEPLGLGDPWELFQKNEWTLDRFSQMASQAGSGESDGRVWGASEQSTSVKIQYLWIWGHGGRVWNDDRTETLVHEQPALDGWNFLADMVNKEWAPPRAFSKAFEGGNQGLFLSGKMALYFGGRQLTTKIPADMNAGVAPMYCMPNGTCNNRGAGNTLGIHSGSKEKEEAWGLLKYITTDGVRELVAVGFTSPTIRSHAKIPEWLDNLPSWDNPDVHDAAADMIGETFFHPIRYDEMDKNFIRPAYETVLLGEKTAQEAFEEIKPDVDAILKEEKTEYWS